MGDNRDYYRGRVDEELAAAERAADAAIARIHLEMAGRYRQLLDAGPARPAGNASVDRAPALG